MLLWPREVGGEGEGEGEGWGGGRGRQGPLPPEDLLGACGPMMPLQGLRSQGSSWGCQCCWWGLPRVCFRGGCFSQWAEAREWFFVANLRSSLSIPSD